MHHCQHKWWDTNIKYRYRMCKYCFHKQYNYGDGWKAEMNFHQFASRWCPLDQKLGGVTLELFHEFEFRCYETWNPGFKITFAEDLFKPYFFHPQDLEVLKHPLAGRTFGPFDNFNEADHKLTEEVNKIEGGAEEK